MDITFLNCMVNKDIEGVRIWCRNNKVTSLCLVYIFDYFCNLDYKYTSQIPILEIIKIFLENGANPNEFIESKYNDSIMHIVSEIEYVVTRIDLIKLLIDYGGDIYLGHPNDNRSTPLFYISQYDNMNGTTFVDEIEKYYKDRLLILDIKEPAEYM